MSYQRGAKENKKNTPKYTKPVWALSKITELYVPLQQFTRLSKNALGLFMR